MRRLMVLALLAATVLSATPIGVGTAAAAGPDASLCTQWTPKTMDTSRGAVPSNFYLDACVTGTSIVIANTTDYPVRLATSGSAGPIAFSHEDSSTYSIATRAASDPSPAGTLVLPGDVVFIPVGAPAGAVTVAPTLDDFDSYSLFSSLFALLPGVSASDAVNELGDNMEQVKAEYEQCLNASRPAKKAKAIVCAAKLAAGVVLALVIFAQSATPIQGVEDLAGSLVQGILSTHGGEFGYIASFSGMATVLNQSADLQITTENLPDGTVGTSYDQTLQVEGGTSPYSWALTAGGLPDGLLLNSDSGQISGLLTTAGTSTFDVTVTDTNGLSDVATFTLSVTSGEATADLPDAVGGIAYRATLPGTGTAPYTWALTSGSLPDGLDLDETTGAIFGTPPLSTCFRSPYSSCTTLTSAFTVQVTDAQGQTSSMDERLRVQPSLECPASCSPQVAIGTFNGVRGLVVISPAQAPCGSVPVQCESTVFVRSADGSVQGRFAFGWRGPNWVRDTAGTNGVAYLAAAVCIPGQSAWADVSTWDGVNGHPFQLVAVSNVVQC